MHRTLLVKRIFSALTLASVLSFSLASAQATVLQDTLKYNRQNETLHAYSWSDADMQPKAVIIGLHGGVQYGGNYAALAKDLAAKGYRFFAIDYRGHGEWLAKSKVRPKVDYIASTEDLISLTDELRNRYPGVPVFCIGESLGAAMAVRAISMKPKLFDGMILASAGQGPAIGAQWKNTFKSTVSGIKTLGRTVDLAPHVRTDISDDQRSNDEMINDPLCRKENSVWDLLHTVEFLHGSRKLADKIGKETPVLVMQGTNDHIIQPNSTKAFYNKLGTKNKKYILFPNVGHLLVTSDFLKPVVVSTVEDWLQNNLPKNDSLTANAAATSIPKVGGAPEPGFGTP